MAKQEVYTFFQIIKWEQSLNSIRLYLHLPKIFEHSMSNIHQKLTNNSCELVVKDFHGQNYKFESKNLFGEIIPEKSEVSIVDKDYLFFYIKKKKPEKWVSLTLTPAQTLEKRRTNSIHELSNLADRRYRQKRSSSKYSESDDEISKTEPGSFVSSQPNSREANYPLIIEEENKKFKPKPKTIKVGFNEEDLKPKNSQEKELGSSQVFRNETRVLTEPNLKVNNNYQLKSSLIYTKNNKKPNPQTKLMSKSTVRSYQSGNQLIIPNKTSSAQKTSNPQKQSFFSAKKPTIETFYSPKAASKPCILFTKKANSKSPQRYHSPPPPTNIKSIGLIQPATNALKIISQADQTPNIAELFINLSKKIKNNPTLLKDFQTLQKCFESEREKENLKLLQMSNELAQFKIELSKAVNNGGQTKVKRDNSLKQKSDPTLEMLKKKVKDMGISKQLNTISYQTQNKTDSILLSNSYKIYQLANEVGINQDLFFSEKIDLTKLKNNFKPIEADEKVKLLKEMLKFLNEKLTKEIKFRELIEQSTTKLVQNYENLISYMNEKNLLN